MGSRKDYAQKRGTKRAASPKKPAAPKTQPQRRKPAQPQNKRPWKALLFSFVGLAGLVYLLNHLLGVEDVNTEQSSQVVKQAQEARKPKQIPAPSSPSEPKNTQKDTTTAKTENKAAKPKSGDVVNTDPQPNKFEFYELLPKSEVTPEKVEAYKSTPRDAKLDKKYVLQAGSFRSEADAEKMRATLLLAGLPNVHTDKSEGTNGIWYRVRVGPFDNRPKLNKAQDKLARMRISAMKVRVE